MPNFPLQIQEAAQSDFAKNLRYAFQSYERGELPGDVEARVWQHPLDLYCDFRVRLVSNGQTITVAKVPGDVILAKSEGRLHWEIAIWLLRLRNEVAAYYHSDLWC